jgi:hypothetical protein
MNNQNTQSARDYHSAAAIASIWVLLLALVVVIELLSLLMSSSMLSGVH